MAAVAPTSVLLDVGGTLWPDSFPQLEPDHAIRLPRLRAAVPGLDEAGAIALFDGLKRGMDALEGGLVQDTEAVVRRALRQSDLPVDPEITAAVRRAMCIAAKGRIELFPGVRALLQQVHELGLVCVVITNAGWRSNEDYRTDFEAFGVSAYVDAICSSVDAGFRKPHPAIFAAALAAAGCPAERCVIAGNSERNDVLPAVALGMRAIRVCIEESVPASSAAHAVATSPDEVSAVLTEWCSAGPRPGNCI